MVPTQDPAVLHGLARLSSADLVPTAVVAVVLAACAIALVLAALRRHDTE